MCIHHDDLGRALLYRHQPTGECTGTVNSQIIGMFLFGDFGVFSILAKLNDRQYKSPTDMLQKSK